MDGMLHWPFKKRHCLEVSREWSVSSAFSQRGLDEAHVDAVSNKGQKSRQYNKNSEKYAF